MCLQEFLCLKAAIFWISSVAIIMGFSTAWRRKEIWKLWCLPNTTRSTYIVCASPPEEQLFRRVAKMYSAIRQGFKSKLLLLLHTSVCLAKMGIMGVNTKLISSKWYGGYKHLECTPRQPPGLPQSRSSRTVIFLASPKMKWQISSPVLHMLSLTPCGLVTLCGGRDLDQHWFR